MKLYKLYLNCIKHETKKKLLIIFITLLNYLQMNVRTYTYVIIYIYFIKWRKLIIRILHKKKKKIVYYIYDVSI